MFQYNKKYICLFTLQKLQLKVYRGHKLSLFAKHHRYYDAKWFQMGLLT